MKEQQDKLLSLRQAAAKMGPGLRGERKEASAEERRSLARQMEEAGLRPPAYLARPRRWVDRPAKLFEAGSYPDKGVEVNADALQRLAQGFDLPAPVLIEHARSPLELGWLTDVRAEGNELLGTITLTEEADRLAVESGAECLSLGLDADLTEIREVSLVRRPRIPDARLFSTVVLRFSGALQGSEDGPWKRKWIEREREERAREAEEWANQWVAEGRMSPAERPFALALLGSSEPVEFGEDGMTAREAARRLFSARPLAPVSQELAPQAASPAAGMDSDAADFFRRRFSGLSLDEIARRMTPAT
jgi:hypothetical protein